MKLASAWRACAGAIGALLAAHAVAQQHLPLTERRGVFADGQEWQITVPANWNGIVVNDLDRVGNTSRANFFLPHGFAYTGTRRHPDRNVRWDPRAESDNNAEVVNLFEAAYGKPRQAIQFGCSGGGSTALSVAEDHPRRFDGVVAMHATSPLTLANMRLDLTFALKALIDPGDTLPLVVDDSGIAAAEAAWVAALAAARTTADGRARMSLALVLAQYPVWGIGPKPDPRDPVAVQENLLDTVVVAVRRAVTSRPQWDNPAGRMSWTTGVDYQRFYRHAYPRHAKIVRDLYARAGHGDVERVIRADIDRINAAPRIAASTQAVAYWRARTHTGDIGVPTLHISNIGDATTPPENMSSYRESVRKAGQASLYRQAFIDAPGHCTFNEAEMAAAVATMVRRIESGRWMDTTSPDAMNALGRVYGVGEARYVTPGIAAGWSLPNTLNRGFFPDTPYPPDSGK